MARVPVIEIVRRAYKIWEAAGKPDGKDQEFYYQAEHELNEEFNHSCSADHSAEDRNHHND